MTTEMPESPGKPPLQREGGKTGSNPESERNTPPPARASRAAREAEQPTVPEDRWLCSELVVLEWVDETGVSRSQTVNLEEIWPQGAILDAEEYISAGTRLRISPESARHESAPEASSMLHQESADAEPSIALHATAAGCAESDTGYALRIEFGAGSEWDLERFPLSHAVSSRTLRCKAAELAAGVSTEAGEDTPRAPRTVTSAAEDAAGRATDEALEQGSLFCLALQASRR